MSHDIQLSFNPGTKHKLSLLPESILSALRIMLDNAGYSRTSLEILCVDDAAIKKLNKESMNCEGPTNILSFPQNCTNSLSPCQPGTTDTSPFLGSLVFSVDTMRRESFLYDQPEHEHLIRLLAHGLAHLLGYDHSPQMDGLCQTLEKKALDDYNQNACHTRRALA